MISAFGAILRHLFETKINPNPNTESKIRVDIAGFEPRMVLKLGSKMHPIFETSWCMYKEAAGRQRLDTRWYMYKKAASRQRLYRWIMFTLRF